MSAVLESNNAEIIENVAEMKDEIELENLDANSIKVEDSPEPKPIEKGVRFADSDVSVSEEIKEEETEIEVLSSSDDDVIALEEEHYMTESDEQSRDSDESSEDDKFAKIGPPIKRPKIRKQPDFFELFGRLPEIDEISISESLAREIAIERGELIIQEPIDEKDEEEEEEQELEATSQAPEAVQSSTEFSDIDYDFESSEEEEVVIVVKRLADEDLFEALVKAEEVPVILFEEPDFEYYERLQEARQIRKDTFFFIRALVDAVVEFLEYIDPVEVLRGNLNRTRLFRELVVLLEEFHVENKINDFVNNKCVIHFRRLKATRPITPEHEEVVPIEKKKFKEAIGELDCLLGKLGASRIVITNRIHESEEELSVMIDKNNNSIVELETLIRKTLSRKGSDSLNIFVERRIKEMSNLREEIAIVRRVLIAHLHNKGRLLEQMANLENINETLHLSDYERMLNEEYSLMKKIEEKNERLQRTRFNFFGCTNAIAHMKEKQSMLYHTIQVQKEVLAEVNMEKDNIRAHIHQLKTNRVRVKKQIREISLQSGLIDKPALLLDFDETVERISELKNKVDGIKIEIKRIQNKIISAKKRSL